MNIPLMLVPPPQPEHLQLVELSHSKKSLMQRCGSAFRNRYEDRLGTKLESANLGYGNCVHSSLAAALTALTLTGTLLDPRPVFDDAWRKYVSTNAIEYSKNWDDVELNRTGNEVLGKFIVDWKARGWEVVCDVDGIPVIERELKVRLPGNIIYTVIIDVLIRTREGKIIVVDFKTPLNVAKSEFYELSDQLLGYQIVCDAHADTLGITQVDGSAFYELTKVLMPKKKSRGAGPQIHVTDIVPRRSVEDVQDWILETQHVANDIRNKRFTRRTRDSFDSGCTLCEWSRICRGLPDPNVYRRKPSTRQSYSVPLEHSSTVPF